MAHQCQWGNPPQSRFTGAFRLGASRVCYRGGVKAKCPIRKRLSLIETRVFEGYMSIENQILPKASPHLERNRICLAPRMLWTQTLGGAPGEPWNRAQWSAQQTTARQKRSIQMWCACVALKNDGMCGLKIRRKSLFEFFRCVIEGPQMSDEGKRV